MQWRLFKQAWWRIKKRFKKTFKCSNNNVKKFILLWRKGVYSSVYMDEGEKYNEAILPEKEEVYGNLNMGDITDGDCM